MVLMPIGVRLLRSRLSTAAICRWIFERKLLDLSWLTLWKAPFVQKSERKSEAGYWPLWMKKTNRYYLTRLNTLDVRWFWRSTIQLAVANAVLISKIARFDYPQDWFVLLRQWTGVSPLFHTLTPIDRPDLLHNLLHVIQTTASASDASSQLLRARSLHVLNLVIKALCSKTLAPARRQFQQIAPDLFRSIASIYVSIADLTISKVASQPSIVNNEEEHNRLLSDLEVTATCLKCLRRLLIHGFTDHHKSQEAGVSFGNV